MPREIRHVVGGLALVAPEREGFAFLRARGALGFRCACGWVVTARSMTALEAGVTDHQVEHCPDAMADRAAETTEGQS